MVEIDIFAKGYGQTHLVDWENQYRNAAAPMPCLYKVFDNICDMFSLKP